MVKQRCSSSSSGLLTSIKRSALARSQATNRIVIVIYKWNSHISSPWMRWFSNSCHFIFNHHLAATIEPVTFRVFCRLPLLHGDSILYNSWVLHWFVQIVAWIWLKHKSNGTHRGPALTWAPPSQPLSCRMSCQILDEAYGHMGKWGFFFALHSHVFRKRRNCKHK